MRKGNDTTFYLDRYTLAILDEVGERLTGKKTRQKSVAVRHLAEQWKQKEG